ncbi:MAG: tyrosine-type recombinase/integrase [Acidobacteriota bacterium]|nr:tyrosine-type recombinase/integrase [Acidobacteriota bacterium]
MIRYRLWKRKNGMFYVKSPEKDAQGKLIYISTGKRNRKEAEAAAKIIISKVESEKFGPNDIPLKTAALKWQSVVEKTNRSFRTVKYQLRRLLAYFGPDKKLREITVHDVHHFIIHLRERKNNRGKSLSEATINRYKALIKRIINYAIETGDFRTNERNPVSRIKNKPEEPRKTFFDARQIALITDKAREISETAQTKNEFYFYYYFSILKMTACRPSEVMSLRNQDYVDGHFNIRATNTKETRFKRIWVHPELARLLSRLPRDTEFIIDVDNKNRNPETFRRIWKRIWRETGINGIPYLVRSSVATILLKEGVPLPVVSKILGHASIEITARHYAHVVEEDKKEGIKMLPKGFVEGQGE